MTPDALDLDLTAVASPSHRPGERTRERQAPGDRTTPEDVFIQELAAWRAVCPATAFSTTLDAAFVLAAAHAAHAALDLIPRETAQAAWAETPAWIEAIAFRPDDSSLFQALDALGLDSPASVGAAFRRFDALRPLAAPAEALMVTDGDPRARLAPETGLNRYGCRALARADALALSACSANEPTPHGLAAAARLRTSLMAAAIGDALAPALAVHADRQKAWVLDWLGLTADRRATVLLTDSGTESTRLAAIGAHDPAKPSVAIVIGPLETGRDIPQAAAQGAAACTGVETIAIRNPASGRPIDPALLTDTIARRIDAAQAQGLDVVLHVLEGSKTGLVAPGIDGVRALQARFPSGLRIIADFCQMRPFSDARPYLELGAAIVATGSKFMGGPAFSGAVVLPPSWRRTGIVEDLKPGTLLRWEAALTEGDAYWRLDPLRRAVGLSRFTQTVREAGADFPEVDVLDDAQPSHIVTLRVRDVETDGWMNQKQLERLGRWLAQDAQPLLPPRAKSFEIRLAGQRCLLGQALTVGPSGALRLAANAQRLAQLAESPVATAQLHQDVATLLSKIALIRRYWPKSN